MVSEKSVEELMQPGTITFMSKDGLASALVTADGDIEAVFKNPQSGAKGAGSSLLLSAVNNGGTKLDCYGEDLVSLYNKYGFEPVAKVRWDPEYAPDGWTYGPKDIKDIYVMKLPDGLEMDEITARLGLRETEGGFHCWTQAELAALPEMEYEDALAYGDSLIEQKPVSAQSAGKGKGEIEYRGYPQTALEYGALPWEWAGGETVDLRGGAPGLFFSPLEGQGPALPAGGLFKMS